MKIRWKLFLSLFLLTSLISVALLLGVEAEFRRWVIGQVTDNFSSRVDALLAGRKERLAGVCETASKLAANPVVSQTLQGGSSQTQRQTMIELYEQFRSAGIPTPLADLTEKAGDLPDSRSGPPALPLRAARQAWNANRQIPLLGVVNMEGEFQFFGPTVNVRRKKGQNAAAKSLNHLRRGDEQLISYVLIDGEKGPGRIREVVVTPVDHEKKQLGWFFVGVNAETSVDRVFQEIEDASGRGIRSGLVVDDEWFLPGMDPAVIQGLSSAVDASFWSNGKPARVMAGGQEYLLVSRDLNPNSPLGKGYQIGVFPLAGLTAAIARLRWIVAGMAAVALLFAGAMAMILARRFSRPIDELVKGTQRVREGDFESTVSVASKDEFGMLASSFNVMIRDLGLKEKYHDLLGKTSDPGLVQSLLDGKIELGGDLHHAAVLFCDIRGFTAMTDGMNPSDVIRLLNDHMMAMTKVIHEHGGVVDKFVGDLVMAVFGLPVGREDDLQRALDCAVAMQVERDRLNGIGSRAIDTGIGIAWGEVVAGMMGSPERMNYTVLGERVNLAARLCSAAGAGEVVTDRATVDAAGDSLRFERRSEQAMKGFKTPVEVWTVKARQ